MSKRNQLQTSPPPIRTQEVMMGYIQNRPIIPIAEMSHNVMLPQLEPLAGRSKSQERTGASRVRGSYLTAATANNIDLYSDEGTHQMKSSNIIKKQNFGHMQGQTKFNTNKVIKG